MNARDTYNADARAAMAALIGQLDSLKDITALDKDHIAIVAYNFANAMRAERKARGVDKYFDEVE